MARPCFLLTGCLLLLSWSVRTTALPVRNDPWRECAKRLEENAPLLLLNASALLKEDLWYGVLHFNRSYILRTSCSETVQACAPALDKAPGCQIQRKDFFNESECLENIVKDLVHYSGIISSYINTKPSSPNFEIPPLTQTLHSIQTILDACSLTQPDKTCPEDGGRWGSSSYMNRQAMSRMMKAFHIRTITFNRAVGYIASGEHVHS